MLSRQNSVSIKEQEEDDEEEIKRFKNFANVTMRLKTDIYSGLEIKVDVKQSNLQEDPISYDLEHKKRQVWSVREIKNFLSNLSEKPVYYWSACQRLPLKTSKEILFFY